MHCQVQDCLYILRYKRQWLEQNLSTMITQMGKKKTNRLWYKRWLFQDAAQILKISFACLWKDVYCTIIRPEKQPCFWISIGPPFLKQKIATDHENHRNYALKYMLIKIKKSFTKYLPYVFGSSNLKHGIFLDLRDIYCSTVNFKLVSIILLYCTIVMYAKSFHIFIG